MSTTSIDIRAGFTDGPHPGFFVRYTPTSAQPTAHVIYLPPFTEEMNRCRAIVAEQARRFARRGMSCTVLDFYGTGESPGETDEATLAIWYENISEIYLDLVEKQPAPVPLHVWGCRLGALIGASYLAEREVACSTLLMWQPVVAGKPYTTQVYRQRLAAMIERGEAKETTTSIRERFARGETVEIGGYTLGGRLMLELDTLDMANLNAPPAERIYWLERSASGNPDLNPRSAKVVEHLSSLGAEVLPIGFTGQPLWQLHERATCDTLLEQTEALPL